MKISLKYKLFILLFITPIISLGVYFYLAKSVFEQDKMAYVFNTGISYTKSLEEQLIFEIEKNKSFERVIIKGLDLKNGKADDVALSILDEIPDLSLFKVYHLKQGVKERKILVNKEFNDNGKNINEELEELLPATEKNHSEEKTVVRFFKKNQGYILFANYYYVDEISSLLIVKVFSLNRFFGTISQNQIFDTLVLDMSGEIAFIAPNFKEEKLKDLTNFRDFNFFKNMVQNNFKQGTFIEGKDFSDKYLVSYVKSDETSFFIIAVVKNEVVMKAMNLLKEKSIGFILLILALTTLIALISSSGLTRALRSLYLASQEIASGNYEIKTQVRSKDEVGELSLSFNLMTEKIKNLLAELRRYNEHLEELVAERTRELKNALGLQQALLDGLDQGFFLFGRDGKILDIYSKAAVQIFGKNPHGEYYQTLVKHGSDREKLVDGIIRNMFEEPIPFVDIANLATRNFENDNERKIFIDYRAIRDEEEKVKVVVAISTDKTDEIKALAEAEKERNYVNSILKMVRSKRAFFLFFEDFKNQFIDLFGAIESHKDDSDLLPLVNHLKRVAHTIKGSAHMVSLTAIAHFINNFETKLADDYIKGNKKITYLELKKIANFFHLQVRSQIEDFISENSVLLGISSIDKIEKDVTLKMHVLEEYFHLLKESTHDNDLLMAYINKIWGSPLSQLLGHYNDLVQKVAKIVEKEVSDIVFKNNKIAVVEKPYLSLFNSFVHIFRNIVDHGIESPDERKKLGKNTQGKITVSILQHDLEHIKIVIEDDGKGIDPAIIRLKLKEKGIAFNEKATDHEIIQMIFLPSFSTKSEVTEISGRGVGLDAVKMAVNGLSGKILVHSTLGKGSSFEMVLPYVF